MKSMRPVMVLFLIIAFTGCARNTETASDTAEKENRTPAEIIKTLRQEVTELLGKEKTRSHYLSINKEPVLCIWYIDDELKTADSGRDIAENQKKALMEGIEIGWKVINEFPIVARLFSGINPMIADSEYNCWYRDIIPIRFLMEIEDPYDKSVLDSFGGWQVKLQYLRDRAPKKRTEDPSDKWPLTESTINKIFREENPEGYSTAYPLVIGNTLVIETYLETESEEYPEREKMYAFAEKIINAFIETDFKPDVIELSTISKGGSLISFSRISSREIEDYNEDKSAIDDIFIHLGR